jgi:hypothetical protein
MKKTEERLERDFEQSRTNRGKSRRHFLRGAGVALALPWLESLNLAKAQDVSAAAANKPPIRISTV